MAEKGGKGGPPLHRKKLATRTFSSKQQAFKGVNNGPSQMDNLVEINSSDSDSDDIVIMRNGTPEVSQKTSKDAPKSGKKVSLESQSKSSSETPVSKGDWGKGGKPYNSGKAGGKSGLPHATAVQPPITEVELKLEMDLPKNARVLMDCEAAAVLQRIQDSLTVLADDPHIKIPESFNKALQYCEISNKYTDTESARQVLDTLKMQGITEGEICMIGNTCPENENELYSLIPSLKANRRKNEGPIKEVLSKLADIKQS